jgi:hypothetical protein
MGLDNLTTMRANVNFMLENRDDLADSVFDRWINWTYIQICNPGVARHRALQTNFTIALATGDIDYDIRSTTIGFQLAGIQQVVYIDGTSATDHTLTRRKLRASHDIRTIAARPFSQGPPHKYTLQGENGDNQGLIIDSQPTAAENLNLLLVDCWRYPDILSAGGDVTVLPPAWDEVIQVGAAWRGWRDQNQPDRAAEMKQQFAEMTQTLLTMTDVDAEDWETRFEVNLQPYQTDARG